MTAELPLALTDFIRARIPTFQAAKLLVLLATHPQREFTAEDIVASMRHAITVADVRKYLTAFVEGGVLTESGGQWRYIPFSRDLETTVSRLVAAYNERPVTLIREIYRIADNRIESRADSQSSRS